MATMSPTKDSPTSHVVEEDSHDRDSHVIGGTTSAPRGAATTPTPPKVIGTLAERAAADVVTPASDIRPRGPEPTRDASQARPPVPPTVAAVARVPTVTEPVTASATTTKTTTSYRGLAAVHVPTDRIRKQEAAKAVSATKTEKDVDDAFLGLRVTDPSKMVPTRDYRSHKGLPRKDGGDIEDLTPPAHVRAIYRVEPETKLSDTITGTVKPGAPVSHQSLVRRMIAKSKVAKDPASAESAPEVASASRDLPATFVPRAVGGPQKTVKLRMDQVKQTIQGIGFSNAFYTNYWHTQHPYSSEIYNHMLRELQPSMLRIRNNYGIGAEQGMKIDAEFLATAQRLLGYKPIVLISGWSPPAWMKVSGQLNGSASNETARDILTKDNRGRFRYADFAQYWVDSLKTYGGMGVFTDYYSPQNEPDYATSFHPTCLFGAQETQSIPGYYEAARAVYQAVQNQINNPPGMVGPESFGMDKYIAEMPFGGEGMFAAVANHLYASGSAPDENYNPYSFVGGLRNARDLALRKGMQNVWVSEYAKLSGFNYQDPLRLAIVMHNSLTVANVSAYLHWDGAWGLPDAGPVQEGTLILVENPYLDRSRWRYAKGYTILHTFWWFKHFSLFIRPSFRRVQCDAVGVEKVLVSAWTGPNGEYSIIFINTGAGQEDITLLDIPVWIPLQTTDRYFSTLDVGFTYAGRFYGDFISIPPLSITTIFSYTSV